MISAKILSVYFYVGEFLTIFGKNEIYYSAKLHREKRKCFWNTSLVCLCLICLVVASFGQDNQLRLVAEKTQIEAEELFNKNTLEARREAAKKYLETLAIWEKLADVEKQAETLNQLVEISAAVSEMQKGLEYAQKVLPLYKNLGNRAMEAETLNNIGSFLDTLGQSREGLTYMLQSNTILNELGDKKREAISLNTTGVLYSNIGEMQAALDYLNRALLLRRETGDKAGEARTIANLATVYSDIGDRRQSVKLFEEALQIIRESGDKRSEAIIQNNLGLNYKVIGEYQKALDNYVQSLELRRKIGDKRGEAVTLSNIAAIHSDLDNYQLALALSEESLRIFQTGKFRRNEATTLSSMASMYSTLGEKEKALQFYEKSLEIRRAIEDFDGESSSLGGIGLIYLSKNQTRIALDFFSKELQSSIKSDNKENIARSYLRLGRGFEQLGDFPAAAENYRQALTIFREIGLNSEVADVLYYFAKLEVGRGELSSAVEKAREAIDLIEGLRSKFSSGDLRANYLASVQDYYAFYTDLLIRLHRQDATKGFDALAFQTAEKARARSLLESLGESKWDIRSGVSAELLEREKRLRQMINAKDNLRLNALRQKQSEKAVEFEKELNALLIQYRDVQTQIRRQSPQFAALTNPEPLNLAEVQSQMLDENTVLLEYVLGAERSFLFAVTKTNIEIFDLPKRESIENLTRESIENIKQRALENLGETVVKRTERLKKADAAAEKNLADLSRLLLNPVAGKIQNKRLLIVASGVLQYLPFVALKSPKPKETNIKDRYLIESNEVVNLPSVSVLALLRQSETRRTKTKNLLAILADPVFSSDDVRLKTLTKQKENQEAITGTTAIMREAQILPPQLRSDFGRLRFSRLEAEAIAGFARNNQKLVAMDFAANLKTVIGEDVQTSGIIHLATHGIINSDFPELSGVVFSLVDENGNPQDGFLRLYEIYNLRLGANLVVLSACETALGKEIKGEGIIGLTRGFMYAGASSVVASLWRVEDKATAELMKYFYQKMLKENLRPADALRRAQISMISEKNTQNPFFWAAFTLQGEYR